MEWETLLQDLIALVENTAPLLWGIALKQVYVHAIQNVVGMVASLGASYVCWRFGKSESDPLLWNVCAVGLIALTVSFIWPFIGQIINPEYYAIELLVNYVK